MRDKETLSLSLSLSCVCACMCCSRFPLIHTQPVCVSDDASEKERKRGQQRTDAWPPPLSISFCLYLYVCVCVPLPFALQTMGQMRLKRRKARDPPDLPSYILDQRIVWLGMEIVPSVAELIVAELLYLASDSSKPVCVYVSSGGTQNEKKQSLSMDTDAYGIVDTMNYINARGGPSRPGKVDNVGTVSMAVADGNAALIVACGSKGHRRAYRNTRFKLAVPRMNPMSGSATDMMIWANNLEDNTKMYVELLAKGTGRTEEQTWKDVNRDRYLDVEEAIEYGLIDAMMPDNISKEKKGLLKKSR